MNFSKKYLSLISLAVISIQFFSCINSTKKDNSFYLNHNDTVDYVGINACKTCHYDKYETFIKTGMGQSFYYATKQKSVADFSKNNVVFDSSKNLYYSQYWKNNELYFVEFRLKVKDTIFKRTEKIDYIIGSGQHTNSHLMFRNGYIFQAPLTWYSQQKKWDLPPGFENGNNSRFSRIINDECISCHNAMPVLEKGNEYKFLKIGVGIDCERCHGPGELHVNIHKQGKSIKSKDGTDRTIVNPARLAWERQIDVCQRCHLQGNAILKKGKSFLQFKPGMVLSDFYEVYMPQYKNKESDFIMASHAQRLQKSKCFIITNKANSKSKLTCITCHNPHISVKETKNEQFNNTCKKCHNADSDCRQSEIILKKENYNCIKCHMPRSGTIDIPHVQIHDHYIRKNPASKQKQRKNEVIGLYCVNNPKPDELSLIKAYLNYYEKFDAKELYLNNARKILNKNNNEVLNIHYLFLKGDYSKIAEIAKNISEADAWTYYRIAQSLINLEKWNLAENYMQKAVDIKTDDFDFLYKLSQIKQRLNKTISQEEILKKIIKLNPKHTQALNDLGFYYFRSGNSSLAYTFYQRCLNTNPDFLPVLKNLFDYYISSNNKVKAILTAKLIIEKEPENKIIKKFLGNDK